MSGISQPDHVVFRDLFILNARNARLMDNTTVSAFSLFGEANTPLEIHSTFDDLRSGNQMKQRKFTG